MLLDLETMVQKHGLDITGCVHVGAHLAEEAPTYAALGIQPVWWIEANPEVIGLIERVVRDFPAQRVIQALVLDEWKATVQFHVTNYNGMSSSVYHWGTHTSFSPDTVVDHIIELPSTSLDELDEAFNFAGCNMMNIDIEGAGLDALRGGKRLTEQMDVLYLEVQTENVYDGAPLLAEYDEFLTGFERVETGMVEGQGWGDALWLRR